MNDPKQKVAEVINRIERGEIAPEKAWAEIRDLKDEYVKVLTRYYPKIRDAEQSWHTFIGNKFQQLIYSILKGYVGRLKSKNSAFQTLHVLTEDEIVKKFFKENNIPVDIVKISGSVEITPALGVAQAIVDLISTGSTLALNDLRLITKIYESEAVLVANEKCLSNGKKMACPI